MKWLLLVSLALAGQDVNKFVQQNAARFTPKASRVQFALIGDQEYTPLQEKLFPNVITAMNKERLEFVVHDGDIKNGKSECDDATFAKRLAGFNRSENPFILTPGDNDWTDCGRPNAGFGDPIERLAKVRSMFFPAGKWTLGKRPLAVLSQSQTAGFAPFVENLMWANGPALFATLHIVGTNNNAGVAKEFGPRNQANLFWLKAAFAMARQQKFRGLMLIMQANPKFDAKKRAADDGFADFVAVLEKETMAFPGQVVLVHGDSHYFRIDKPLVPALNNPEGARLENFTRVETFGPPDVHWIRATADSKDPMVFQFEQRIVEANIRKR